MRIAAFYFLDGASDVAKKRISEQLVPAAIAYYQTALKVIPNADPIIYSDSTIKKCIQQSSPKALKDGVEADLVLFITGLSNPDLPVLALANACDLHPTTNRPIAGQVQFNYAYQDGTQELDFQASLYTTLHEIGHILAFSASLYQYFIDPKTGRKLDNPTMQKTVNGQDITVLTTGPLTTRLRKHFNCPNLEGAYLENEGSLGSAGSHFERRIFMNDFSQ